MLAELAAANAAFAIIKKTIQNTGDLTRCGKAISDLIIAKEELKRKGNKKRKGSIRKGDLEEFIALEKLRQQESELRSWMQLYGRAGLYRDWQEFQATKPPTIAAISKETKPSPSISMISSRLRLASSSCTLRSLRAFA